MPVRCGADSIQTSTTTRPSPASQVAAFGVQRCVVPLLSAVFAVVCVCVRVVCASRRLLVVYVFLSFVRVSVWF